MSGTVSGTTSGNTTTRTTGAQPPPAAPPARRDAPPPPPPPQRDAGGPADRFEPNRRQQLETRRRELTDQLTSMRDRTRGAERNLQNTRNELAQASRWTPSGLFSRASGVRSSLVRQEQAEVRLLGQYRQNVGELERALDQVNRGLAAPEVRPVDTRQHIRELQGVNQDLSRAQTNLQRTETVLRTTRNVAVVAGATVATGGLATVGVGTAIAGGTLAGTTIGGLSNLAEAGSQVGHGNLEAGEAFRRAGTQTVRDAQTSFTASVGTVAGLGVAGRIAPQGATAARQVLGGMAAGGTNAATNNALNTGIDVATGQRRLEPGRMARDFVQDTVVGTISGGVGARTSLGQTATEAARTTAARAGVQATADTAIGLGSAYTRASLEGRQMTFDEAAQEIQGAIIGNTVGGIAARASRGPAPRPAADAPVADTPAPATRPLQQYRPEDISHHPRRTADERTRQYQDWAADTSNDVGRRLAAGEDPHRVLNDTASSYSDLRARIDPEGALRGDYVGFGRPRSGTDAPSHTLWHPDMDVAHVARTQPEGIEFRNTADREVTRALEAGTTSDLTYRNTYETRDGGTIPGTRVATEEGRVYYPNGNDSRAILQDVMGRANDLLGNAQNRPRADVLNDFADLAHGYHQAMPFDRGSDGISQAYLRGLYQAATGERMPAIRYVDVNAQLMPRDSFRAWFLGQLGGN